MTYTEILNEKDGPSGTIALNRPCGGNLFTETMGHEIRDCINDIRHNAGREVRALKR